MKQEPADQKPEAWPDSGFLYLRLSFFYGTASLKGGAVSDKMILIENPEIFRKPGDQRLRLVPVALPDQMADLKNGALPVHLLPDKTAVLVQADMADLWTMKEPLGQAVVKALIFHPDHHQISLVQIPAVFRRAHRNIVQIILFLLFAHLFLFSFYNHPHGRRQQSKEDKTAQVAVDRRPGYQRSQEIPQSAASHGNNCKHCQKDTYQSLTCN